MKLAEENRVVRKVLSKLDRIREKQRKNFIKEKLWRHKKDILFTFHILPKSGRFPHYRTSAIIWASCFTDKIKRRRPPIYHFDAISEWLRLTIEDHTRNALKAGGHKARVVKDCLMTCNYMLLPIEEPKK